MKREREKVIVAKVCLIDAYRSLVSTSGGGGGGGGGTVVAEVLLCSRLQSVVDKVCLIDANNSATTRAANVYVGEEDLCCSLDLPEWCSYDAMFARKMLTKRSVPILAKRVFVLARDCSTHAFICLRWLRCLVVAKA